MSKSREIISISVGQTGVQLGVKFWEHTAHEHGILADGLSNAEGDIPSTYSNMFFNESSQGKFVPRSLFVDMDPSITEKFKASKHTQLINPDNIVEGVTSAKNNFSRGYLSDGAEMIEAVDERLRYEVERCNHLQALQVIHGLGGGCGSGLGLLILDHIRETLPDKTICSVSVVPSPKVSDIVVESYNAMLTMAQLTDLTDLTILTDNEALFDICGKTLKLTQFGFRDLNYLIVNMLLGVTASMRFPGQLNGDIRKLCVNLVPFPRLHFLMPSVAPLYARHDNPFRIYNPIELIPLSYHPQSMMTACNPLSGLYLTTACLFRGVNSIYQMQDALKDFCDVKSKNFVEWIPDNTEVVVCDIPQRGTQMSSTMLANNTSIHQVFKRICEQFSAMFRRKAFLHWYTGEGMEEQEFTIAEVSVIDLISEYQTNESRETGEEFDLYYDKMMEEAPISVYKDLDVDKRELDDSIV